MDTDTRKVAKILKALSNANRLELYLEIAKRNKKNFETSCYECFISEIAGSLNIGAPTISHHLKELTNADLIHTERRGKFLVASINEKTINMVKSLLPTQTE
ncbi:MAG: winged helix-turn-helix transcriptional regulator [Desulfobacteraceae bacterium]|nr:winged helix-turn-helix transcriptional regulator [Desulfobacteraceae bacterium]